MEASSQYASTSIERPLVKQIPAEEGPMPKFSFPTKGCIQQFCHKIALTTSLAFCICPWRELERGSYALNPRNMGFIGFGMLTIFLYVGVFFTLSFLYLHHPTTVCGQRWHCAFSLSLPQQWYNTAPLALFMPIKVLFILPNCHSIVVFHSINPFDT